MRHVQLWCTAVVAWYNIQLANVSLRQKISDQQLGLRFQYMHERSEVFGGQKSRSFGSCLDLQPVPFATRDKVLHPKGPSIGPIPCPNKVEHLIVVEKWITMEVFYVGSPFQNGRHLSSTVSYCIIATASSAGFTNVGVLALTSFIRHFLRFSNALLYTRV